MRYNYHITLKPLEPFFFGGMHTFGSLGDEQNGSYLAKSEYFPQQSALLGMLRREILIQAGLLSRKVRGEWVDKDKKEEAKRLVGSEKFCFNKEEQNYGVIKAISPIYIQREATFFYPFNGYEKYKDIVIEYKSAPLLKGYNPKEHYFFDWLSDEEKKCWCSYGDIFERYEMVGNRIGGKEDAFYKKIAYRLDKKSSFAFDIACEFDLKSSIIHLGADRGAFLMEVSDMKDGGYPLPQNDCIVLLSDSYIPLDNIEKYCSFAITEEVSHSHLQGNKKRQVFEKAEPKNFYKRGSIFFKPKKELIEAIESQKNLRKIGYNHYIKGE